MQKYLTKKEFDNLIGSWHPRGYHGHFRSKSRIDLSNLYRQKAKPSPPNIFLKRQNDDATKHNFSKHDNRQDILNNPLVFGSGLGKKKIDSVNKNKWNPEFISWCEDNGRDRLKNSIYQKDYCFNGQASSKLLSARKNMDQTLSTYTLNYSNEETSVDTYREIRRDTYQRFIQKNRAKSSVSTERSSVASCMVWYDKIVPTKTDDTQSNH